MKLLEDKIKNEGIIIGDDILKVDMFLNHQIDPVLMNEMGKEFARLFKDSGAERILTVETSGVPIAVFAGYYLNIPVVFAKKASHKYVGAENYTAECFSYTHGTTYEISVSKKYLPDGEKILIIDDFLADGNATKAMLKLIEQCGGQAVGIGIAVEKGFQPGGKFLRDAGYNLRSLAIVDSMNENGITFRH